MQRLKIISKLLVTLFQSKEIHVIVKLSLHEFFSHLLSFSKNSLLSGKLTCMLYHFVQKFLCIFKGKEWKIWEEKILRQTRTGYCPKKRGDDAKESECPYVHVHVPNGEICTIFWNFWVLNKILKGLNICSLQLNLSMFHLSNY